MIISEQELYEDAIKLWGKESQVLMAIEEMGELLQVLSKVTRKVNGCPVIDVINEIVDVDILLQQLKVVFEVKDKHYNIIKAKKLQKLKSIIDKCK